MGITGLKDMSLSKPRETVKDGKPGVLPCVHGFAKPGVHGVIKSLAQLSN